MENNGIGMISSKYKASDFLELELEINSEEAKWSKAIDIFENRFLERYFAPIQILSEDSKINGFAIMAINCLMIDTFYQFEEGVEQSANNKRCYVSFLRKHLSHIFIDDDLAIKFYERIRCGILHSAQTKKGSMLSIESASAIEYYHGQSGIKVNVNIFSKEIEKYFKQYIKRLVEGDIETRTKFITKMYYLCDR